MASYRSCFADNVSAKLEKHVLTDPDAFIASGKLIKNDKTTTVSKVEFEGVDYLVKRYNARSKWHRVKRSLRQSRASICWRASHLFLSAGIHVSAPVGMIERRIGLIRGDAFFISKWIEGEELLNWLPVQENSVIKEVAQQTNILFEKFKRNRLSHGDLKATNLLWSKGKIFVVDLDSVRQYKFNYRFSHAHKRDCRRFSRNGQIFSEMLGE